MSNILSMRGVREVPRNVKSKMDTLLINQEVLNQWVVPPFQRPLRVNDKVRAIGDDVKETGVIPGIITLGQILGNKSMYIIDGQHRIEAARIAGNAEIIVDVCIKTFDNMADMGQEFVDLNSQLVRMRPDDVIRGLEANYPAIKYIRKECPFVGYDQIRRGSTGSALLSVSASLRCWNSAKNEAPSSSTGANKSALESARDFTLFDAEQMCRFLNLAKSAWGVDPSNYRLWGNLNLTLCMWLYVQMVIEQERGVKRFVVLTNDQFKKCLMSVSASQDYSDWLVGRILNERDRSPCYNRLKAIFAARLREDARDPSKKVMMPQPSWAS